MNKKNILTFLPLALIILGLGLYVRHYLEHRDDYKKTATLTVVVAPSDSSVKLNGHKGHPGSNKVIPGNYTVIISRRGFASSTKYVNVTNTKETKMGVALVPNRPDTTNWYKTHPDDARIAQTITDPQYATVSTRPATQPITSLLPFIAGGVEFRIDVDPKSTNTNNPTILITALSETAKQDALTWMINRGYDPSKLNIKFVKADPNTTIYINSGE